MNFSSLFVSALGGMGDFGDLGGYGDILGQFSSILTMAAWMSVIYIIAVIVVFVMYYVVTAFKWMFIGRKAGLEKDWMPFVPFAHTVYRLRIVDEPWWCMFFLDGWGFYSFILYSIINAIGQGKWTSFALIVNILYLLCCLAYNIYYRYKFYTAHRMKPHLAMTILVPWLGFIREALDYYIAFTKAFPFTGEGTSRVLMDVVDVPQHKDDSGSVVPLTVGYRPAADSARGPGNAPHPKAARSGGSITGLSGMYAGQVLPMADNDEMVIGRDNAFSNLIVDQNADKVSRKHCGIMYDAARGAYVVTDYSTNGTFIDGGNRLVANMATTLQRGSVIALGNRENRFKLN